MVHFEGSLQVYDKIILINYTAAIDFSQKSGKTAASLFIFFLKHGRIHFAFSSSNLKAF